MIESLKPIIQSQPFFAGVSETIIDVIVGCAENVKITKGAHLMHEGQPANVFFLIREGRVGISIHGAQFGAIPVETLEAGEMVGWSWLVPPYRARFDARAVEDTRALRFDGECLRGTCEEDHVTGYELLKRVSASLAQRLESSRLQLIDVYGRAGAR